MAWGLFFYTAKAQTNQNQSLTLDDCIAMALEQNLNLRSAKLSAASSKINYNQSRADVLPSINANYNIGVSRGRSIDPFTNSYSDNELTFSNAGLNLNVTVFNGFKLLNTIKQRRYNALASNMEIEDSKQNLILEVTLAYIQVLNSRDALDLATNRLETTKSQLERLEIFFKEERGNPVDYRNMQGQYASDLENIVLAENNLKTAVLNLANLLNTDLDYNTTFETILGLMSSNEYGFSYEEVYTSALQNLAGIKSKALKIDAADAGVKAARSNFFPEVSFFGALNTNYSSIAKSFTEAGVMIRETGDFVSINNQDYPVLTPEKQFEGSHINYNDQFNNNLNSVVGLSVRVPLFNGFRTKNDIALSKIELEQNQVELENTKLLFKQSIEQSYNNMASAYKRYALLQDQVKAFEEAFRINEVRFNNGVSNIVEYLDSKNNMEASKLNLNRTKYEYVLRVKILDYYRGIE